MTTATYSTVLVAMDCCECGVPFGISTTLNETCLNNRSRNFWCPNGHTQHYLGETEAQKLKRELKWQIDRNAAERARADGAEASLRATKGHVTRLRKQVLAGECPLCGQHLRDLARHISRQHPDEPVEDPTR